MENMEHKVDRTGWPKGEWDNEPDRVDFIHSGFSCLLLRNQLGNWCGYVGLPPGHKYFGIDYNDIPADVHGGLTYSDHCRPPICHIPKPGMPENVWWIGFDCAHLGDYSPGLKRYFGVAQIYRNMSYVHEETKKLAEQMGVFNG